MKTWDKIKAWYRGTYVPPPENDPESPLVIISPGYYEQPLSARILGTIGRFCLQHWQWIIGTILAIVAIIIAA